MKLKNTKCNNLPELEIICSVFNSGKKLSKTIQTIQEQSFTNWHCTVIDDNSDDLITKSILFNETNKDPRFKIFVNKKTFGLTKNLVTAVRQSRAKYIARADAGDWWILNKLEKQISALKADEDLVCIGTQCNFFNERNEIIGSSWFAENDQQIKRNLGLGKGVFVHSSIVFRRITNYRKEFKYSQDLDLYLRLSQFGTLRCLPEALTFCSLDKTGITLNKKPWQRRYQALAYNSFLCRENMRSEIVLQISEPSRLEIFLWNNARHLFCLYIMNATKKNRFKCTIFLTAACLMYPYLISDYFQRFKRALWLKWSTLLKK